MDELYKKIPKNALAAIVAIIVIAIIYSFSPKVGGALLLLILVVGAANAYKQGYIKPATT